MNQETPSNYNPLLKYLDKIVFGLAILYLGLVLYWLNQPKPSSTDSLVQPKPKPSLVSNTQFIAYLKQSFKVIEAKPKPTPSPSPEKVYIPIYPSAKPNNPLPLPPITLPTKVTTIPPKPTKVTTIPPKPTKVTTIPPKPTKVTAIPPKPTKVTTIPPKPTKVTTIPPLNSSVIPPEGEIMLIGVLESEANSVAIFSFKGNTKRLQAGELVGSSGWTFQGVLEQKAVISKDGKTRYIEIGQKF